MAVRLLLINPCPPESFWSFRWATDRVLLEARTLNPPLGLATLAALCPPDWQVTIVDESVEPVPVAPEADLVGVCGMGVQHPRQRELLAHFRRQGYFTVAGGSFASLCPERFEGLADCIVAGESERIWPEFCRDWERGTVRSRYQENGTVALDEVPVPRFDLLKLDRYVTASLQFSRGCPYRCDFCDIIVMFGRQPRTKRPEQIGRELDALRAQGARSAFLVDDNLIGNKKVAKELLRYLADYQRRLGYPFEFGTEASLNLASDSELLALFRDAGFTWVFLGIETPDSTALAAAGKVQNTKGDLLESVRTLYRYGIDVFAGFIIGFDADDASIFERQYRFIVEAGIQVSMVGLLTALPKTPLHARLEREGRIREDVAPGDNTRARTNVIPAGMSYEQMIAGYVTLYRRLFADDGIAWRIRNKTRYLRRPVGGGASRAPGPAARMLLRLLAHGIAPGGPRRWRHFARTLRCPPRLWPMVITDWVRGLAMRDYVRRHLQVAPERAWASVYGALASLRERFAPELAAGAMSADVDASREEPGLALTVHAPPDGRFFERARRQLTKMLRQPGTRLTLQVERLAGQKHRRFKRLLRALERYDEQVSLRLAASVHSRLRSSLARLPVRVELLEES